MYLIYFQDFVWFCFWIPFTTIFIGFGWIWRDCTWILFDLASGFHLLGFWLDLTGLGLISVGFYLIWVLALLYLNFGWILIIWVDLFKNIFNQNYLKCWFECNFLLVWIFKETYYFNLSRFINYKKSFPMALTTAVL